MMQPTPIYKALLTFWNTATDMLVGHLQHFCMSKICLPLAGCLILKLYIHVCVCTVVNLKVTLIHSQCSTQQKQGQIGVKLPFLRSMIPYIVHIPFFISVCSVRLTILLFSKLNKKGLLSEFHAHKFNGYVVYRCDLFATFLLVEMVWAVIQSRYLSQAWDKIYSRDHMQFLVWSNF